MTESKGDDTAIVAEDIPAPPAGSSPSSAKIFHGKIIPAQQHILLFSAEEWEAFIEEWAHHLKTKYVKVVRLTGANDMGVDIAGFVDGSGLKGAWENHQCKNYGKALAPGDAIPEIGKCLWHAYKGRFAPPRKYYFMAPKDCGMALKRLLLDAEKLKSRVFEKWNDWCADAITSTEKIELTGDFRDFVESFDFSIFTFKTTLTVIDEHAQTPYHAARFGGGLPERPGASKPPETPVPMESRYLQQLFQAYADHKSVSIANIAGLGPWPELSQHYHRQREYFYHAESLRSFARDSVPPGTFEELQEEVSAGVFDVAASTHADGLARVNAVTQTAAQLPLTANALISVTKVQDKRGICHQLANEDRLTWVKK